MGLLGNGDDSSLTSNTGWGMMPPMNSGADWTALSSNTTTSTTGNSSSTIGANSNSSNNHNFQTGSISSTVSCWQTPAATSSLINNGRSSQLVSTNSSTSVAVNSINHEQNALSASPKLSSSWAQAAGKGLNTSSNSNSSHIGSNSQANSSNNVILQSSSNSNALAVSSSSTSDYRSSIATNGPNQNIGVNTNNTFSHDSYSAAINNGSNNQQSSMNSNNTTGSCSSATTSLSSAFQQAQHGANNSSMASLSSENGSGVSIGNKRAITNANIQDIIGNLSDDVRETLLTEKWRLPVINQDSPWNLPPSEQTSSKDTSQWRSPVNSGTEIWENTVRQKKGSQPNVGGNLMMTNNDGLSPGVGGIGVHTDGNGSAVGSSQTWNPPTVTHSIGGTWGEEEDTSNLWVSTPITPVGNASTSSGNSLTSINNWSSNGSNNVSFNNNNWNNAGVNTDLVKGYDSGKNNSKKSWNTYDNSADASANEQNWDKIGDNFGTWQPDQQKKESGWDKESNDNCKGSVDDGTAVWGNPVRQTKVSNWKDNPANKNGLLSGWNKSNVGGNSGPSNGNHKSNQMQNRTWVSSSTDSGQRKSPLWNDETNSTIKVNGNATTSWPTESNSSLFWPDSIGVNNIGTKLNQKGHGNGSSGGVNTSTSNTAMPTQNNWMDSTQMDNNHWNQTSVNNPALSNRQQHNLTTTNQKYSREIIQSNNQYKNLIGFKKDNVETALRNNQIRPDDAIKELKNISEDDVSLRTNQCALSNDRLRLFNAQNSATAAVAGAPSVSSNVINALNNNNKQMFTLLQTAISAGIINSQILSRPMSAQNLELLSEILQQYKMLRQLQESRDVSAQTKLSQIQQKIMNLQNQIYSSYQTPNSQFLVMPQQTGNRVGNNSVGSSSTNSIDYFKPNSSTSGNGNNNTTGNDLSSFDFGPTAANQGSRLNSWKSQLKSDERSSNSNFIRAPGPLSKHNSISNANWPSTFGNASDDGSNWNADKGEFHGSNLIDDYEYDSFDCKTWKTHGAKALDDDTRTLLNMSKDFPWNNKATILNSQTDSFGGSFSTPANPNTWSYNPLPGQQSTSNTNIFDLGLATNKTAPKKSNWGNANDYADSLWSGNSSAGASGQSEHNVSGSGVGNSTINKPRPPPGLSGKMAGNGNGQTSVWNSSGLSANNSATTSEYLRLRNLTPQIDGSTLKTLCLQHGPLNHFHLSLNHGVAIVRYSTRDQAIKAQSALNNCVLGNTTIIADLPPDNELSQFSMIIGGGSAIQQQQSNTNNINSLASSWSNGTNASHSVAVGAAASANGSGQSGNNGSIQSYQNQNHQAAVVQHRTAIQANTSGNANNNSAASTSQTLPYGTTHSATHSFRPGSVNSGSNQFNSGSSANSKMVDSGMGVWNSNMWDLSNAGATAPTGSQSSGNNNLWSAAGFSNTDRNTPIQNFLPNDLLAGENN